MKTLFLFMFISVVSFGQNPIICEGEDCAAPKCEDVEAMEVESWDDIPGNYTGAIKFCHENGSTYRTGKYVNGQKQEKWATFHQNGMLSRTGNYVDDKKQGDWERYHKNGQLKQKGNWVDNQRQELRIYYHNNGHLNRKGEFIDDYMQGEWTYYDDEGKLMTTRTYKDGEVIRCEGKCD